MPHPSDQFSAFASSSCSSRPPALRQQWLPLHRLGPRPTVPLRRRRQTPLSIESMSNDSHVPFKGHSRSIDEYDLLGAGR